MDYALVFLGGGLGSLARYGLGGLVQDRAGATFPWGTLTVNVLGALAIGALMAVLLRGEAAPGWRLFLAIGFLGGFTTFSTLCYEGLGLLQTRSYGPFVGYALGTNVAGFLACWLGLVLARRLLGG